ncbi:hypothetical protein HY468_04615, partial [Candidatus Roizmanbacteria bacterium]|nr:hypothetical protein [Candidatus Roizmanbacteria bacterium]
MDQFDTQLYEVLKKSGFIKQNQLDEAYHSATELARSLSDVLIFRGLITEEVLGQLIADNLKTPYATLKNKIIPDDILALVPEHLARKLRVVPIAVAEKKLALAMEDPTDVEAVETIRRRVGIEVVPYFITKTDLVRALNQYKRNFAKKFESIIVENVKKASH